MGRKLFGHLALSLVNYWEMESIMQFIYLGEATFYAERMDELLAVAKSLEIKELCNAGSANDEPEDEPSPCVQDTSTEKLEEQNLIKKEEELTRDQNTKYQCEQCQKTYSCCKSLWQHKQSAHVRVKYACDKCDYQATKQSHLNAHIQSKHEGVKYSCDQCEYKSGYQRDLTIHIQSKHEGIKYACDQCDYQATNQGNLRTHMRNKHKVIQQS